MKTIFAILILFLIIIACSNSPQKQSTSNEQSRTPTQNTLTGNGNKLETINLNSGKAIFDITINSNDYHSVWLNDENGKKMELLTDGSDVYNSQKIINIKKSGVYYLQIIAKTKWSINISN